MEHWPLDIYEWKLLQPRCFSTNFTVPNSLMLSIMNHLCWMLWLKYLLLTQLTKKTSNSSKPEDRTTRIHNKDCELMGLTWLLAKNRTAYIHTVSGVLRALMLSSDGSHPQSCTLNRDGMPMAVDSSQISDPSSSINIQPPVFLCLIFYFLLHVHLTEQQNINLGHQILYTWISVLVLHVSMIV